MSDQGHIEFRKVRDLGRIISDTITFLKEEWQPLISTVIKASIIPVVIALGVGIYFTGATALALEAYFAAIFGGDISNFMEYENVDSFFMTFFFFSVVITFAYAAMSTSILAYIRSYIDGRGLVNYEEIKSTIRSKLLSYFLLSILIGIITVVGYVLCFLPGIYFGVTLALSGPILIFNERGTFDAIGDAFNFIKGHWWNTFGVMIVIGILIAVLNWLLNLPMEMYAESSEVDFESDGVFDILADPIYVVFIIFSYLVQFFFHIVSMISMAFVYYDIEEQENPSSPDIINEIGAN